MARLDRELLKKFQIKNVIQIQMFKLQLTVKNNVAQKPTLKILIPVTASSKSGIKNVLSSANKDDKPFKCNACKYASSRKDSLKRHSLTHSTDYANRRFKCDKCNYRTNYNWELKNHTELKHNKNPGNRKRYYQCPLCSHSFFIAGTLKSHMSTHTKEKPFPCQFCSKMFAKNGTKNSHEIICINNPKWSDSNWIENHKRYQCKFCNKRMRTQGQLTIHERFHAHIKPFKCDKCDYSGASTWFLKYHVEIKHNPNRQKNIACQFCQKMFFTNGALHLHIRTHTKETPIDSACEFCKKQFSGKPCQTRHQNTCKFNPKNLIETVEKHKKKPANHKCKLCEYSSTLRNRFKMHEMTHTGHRPFQCTFCNYASKRKTDLYVHLRMHTGEKPHKCPHCDFRTNHSTQIIHHVKRCVVNVKEGSDGVSEESST